ncbi:hypothetical protein OESDEN_03433 [Oesophagostomum dentatum]|uniref:AMP-binding enzyme C-terminal domain-containing protein n=1 Tax=Oesophagostomum dentatum TaxID=61180 RepID=A0A0B1TLB9_OESDE|nr:hypothetical protein OESDEN_03433 [Oesophagostomum dentatum]
MLGYFNMAEDDENLIDEHRWLRTGDLLYYDEDGFYYVVDRVKDLIKVNGVQVSPSELVSLVEFCKSHEFDFDEDVILTHPSVKEAAVVGIDHPESGQVPKAFIVLQDGVDEEAAVLSVRALVNEKLAPVKQLRGGVEFCAELPKTSSGKVKRSELRKRFPS